MDKLMNFPILLLIFTPIVILIAIAATKPFIARKKRIEAAKQRSVEISARSVPIEIVHEIVPVVDLFNIIEHDELTEEQAHIMRKIFEDDSVYLKDSKLPHSGHWKDTEPQPLKEV